MKCTIRSGIACLPVTALHIINHDGTTYILSGAGSSLTVHNATTYQQVLRKQIFPSQNIHGIESTISNAAGGALSSQIVVWGGKLLCFLTLITEKSTASSETLRTNMRLHTQEPVYCGDWIFSASFDTQHIGVFLLTAHNALYYLQPADSTSTTSAKLQSIGIGLQTLLYSGHIMIARSDHMIIASGTVFGEIVVWTCSRENAQCEWRVQTKHVFLGHQGSVFGVCISAPILIDTESRRFLASCSDDRTVRIWDISSCDSADENLLVTHESSKQTGFGVGQSDMSHIAMTWGHTSRIWNISFVQDDMSVDDSNVSLVSRGEDGFCQCWSIDLHKNNSDHIKKALKFSLKPGLSDRHHTGKNVWSSVHGKTNSQDHILTGGADGQIITRQICSSERSGPVLPSSTAFVQIAQSIVKHEEIHTKPSRLSPKALKQYLILDNDQMLATTDIGDVVWSDEVSGKSWSNIYTPTKKSSTILSCNHEHGIAFFSGSDATLSMFNLSGRRTTAINISLSAPIQWMQVLHVSSHPVNHSPTTKLLVNIFGGKTILLTINQAESTVTTEICNIETPSDFIVTSGYYNDRLNMLFCGSRAGALAVFQSLPGNTDDAKCVLCVRHIHASDSVTSITELSEASQDRNSESICILTTGRDGTFACHTITQVSKTSELRLRTVHRSNPPFGPYIEGAYVTKQSSGSSSLVLYGFHSKNFVVWDESCQTQLMSVDCGGAHRSWAYHPTQCHKGAGTFVWTKAGTFNMVQNDAIAHHIIQHGGHGREIKAFAISPKSIISAPEGDSPRALLATGAEDTDIRLFDYKSNHLEMALPASLKCVAVLKGHTTGLQHLMFSNCGQFLFSSAGCEEFFVWRLYSVPLLSIGITLVTKLSKDEEDSDARIMSFDFVKSAHTLDGEAFFVLSLAYSNGKTKHLRFVYDYFDHEGTLEILHQTDSGAICLTQIHSWSESGLDPFLLGATDGSLKLVHNHDTTNMPVQGLVHQSNIAAMTVHALNSHIKVIITGGDDNAIGFTMLQLISNSTKPQMKTTLVPDAHAAAVTAVTTLEVHDGTASSSILIVTAGNDQKVKLWRANINHVEDSISDETYGPSIQLDFICERPTDVADVSDMDVVYQRREEEMGNKYHLCFEVMVVGVGMQVISFDYED